MTHCIVTTTCQDNEEAQKIAAGLVEKKLAACVQLSSITSVYRWQGEVHNDPEIRLVIKTTENLYKAVEEQILSTHSYDLPQIIKTPITGGLPDFLEWISENATG